LEEEKHFILKRNSLVLVFKQIFLNKMADSGGGGPSRGRGNWRGGNNRWKRGNYRGRANFRGYLQKIHFKNDKNILITFTNVGGRGGAAPVSRPNQRITDSYSPVPCPYKGWKHYFPTQGYSS